MKNPKIKHEAIGSIYIGRISSSKKHYLAGSNIPHSELIELKISEADLEIGEFSDHVYSNKTLISVYITPEQLGQLLTRINYHGGIPCTINTVGNKQRERLPSGISSITTSKARLNKQMADINITIDNLTRDVERELETVKISKTKKRGILKQIERLVRHFKNSIPFYQGLIQENIEKTTNEAKEEILQFAKSQNITKRIKTISKKLED